MTLAQNDIRILNFDNSLLEQKELLSKYKSDIDEFSDIGGPSRYWASDKDLNKIRSRLNFQDKNKVTFIGSGDYHHISFPIIEKFTQPISVVIFDNHPDWDTFTFRLNCGSWVNNVLKLPNIKKVISIGIASNDLDNLSAANLSELNHNKIEIYPFRDKPSKAITNVSGAKYVKFEKGLLFTKIYWRNLANEPWQEFISEIISHLPTDEIYVSIDKDVLTQEYALTNWEAGKLTLEKLLYALKALKEKKNISGLDICGEYSTLPKPSGLLKPYFSKSDHPSDIPAKKDIGKALEVNQRTNLRILKALFGY